MGFILIIMLLKSIFFMLSLFSFAALANDNLQFSAFGTIGLTVSDSERYGYRQDISYDEGVYSGDIDFLNNSVIGIQLDASLGKDIDFVGQATIRDMADAEFDRYITLAFLKYTPNANWQVRLGRTSPDIFLVTEFRDVGVAYIWSTPPNEVYGMIPFRSLDGVDVAYMSHFNDGTLRTKFFTGQAESVFSSVGIIEPIKVKNIYGLSLAYDTIDWIAQAQHTQVEIANENSSSQQLMQAIATLPDFIWPNAGQFSQELKIKGKHASYTSVSGQAHLGNYLISGELAQINSNDTDIVTKLISGYVSLAYQYDEHTFYSVYSFTDSDRYTFNEPGVSGEYIPEIINGVESIHNFYASNQRTLSIGWRWDYSANIASSLQWNNTHIDKDSGTLWLNNSSDSSADTVNVLMLSVSISL